VKTYYVLSWRRGISYVENRRGISYVENRRGISYVENKKEDYLDWSRGNCLLKRVIEGKVEGRIEVSRRRGRRRKELLGELQERKGYRRLKDGALDRIVELALEGTVDLSQEKSQTERRKSINWFKNLFMGS
jgi:hypothetical protein